MPAPTKPYTFTAGTTATAAEVNEDFDRLYSALAADYVRADATIPFTALPSAPALAVPASGGQLVNKNYVDDTAKSKVLGHVRSTTGSSVATAPAAFASDALSVTFSAPQITADHPLRVSLSYGSLFAPGLGSTPGEFWFMYGANQIWQRFSVPVNQTQGRTLSSFIWDNSVLTAFSSQTVWVAWNGPAVTIVAAADNPVTFVVEQV